MKKINQLLFIALGVSAISLTSCKKEEPETVDSKIGGCLDPDSPLYNANADFEDQSCLYAYVSAYEITFHPEEDGGSDWDFLTNTDADLILRIKEEGATNWLFESAEISNQAHNVPAVWTAPINVKLLNQNYEWELVDYDATSSDDLVATGTFNPIDLANDGEIIASGTNPNGGQSQLRITYNLDE